MSYIEVYQGDTLRINLSFSDENGNPYNISGSTLFYAAKQNYSSPNPVIYKVITGFDNAVSGICSVNLSSVDTSICAQDYVAEFRLSGDGTNNGFSGVQTFNTDGLRVLPSTIGVI